jgi:Fur family ferric uptake transcriptional regulator
MDGKPQKDHNPPGVWVPQARGTRVRSTRQAAAIVAVMSGMRAFCGARDLYDALRAGGQQVGLATVYRHLRVLAERGDVDMIQAADGESRHRLRASSATCHLACRARGQVVAVDGSEIRDWAGRFAAGAGFALTGYTVELSGLCPAHSRQHGVAASSTVAGEVAATTTGGGGLVSRAGAWFGGPCAAPWAGRL